MELIATWKWESGPDISVTFATDETVVSRVSLGLSQEEEGLQAAVTGKAPFPLLTSIYAWLEWYCLPKRGLAEPEIPPIIYPNPVGFYQEVWGTLTQVPFGSVTSYGDLARQTGRKGAARAVGTACNKNLFPLIVPCHRVIASNGRIGGFALDLEIKQRLLDFERPHNR